MSLLDNIKIQEANPVHELYLFQLRELNRDYLTLVKKSLEDVKVDYSVQKFENRRIYLISLNKLLKLLDK
jgi:hypothetical protein